MLLVRANGEKFFFLYQTRAQGCGSAISQGGVKIKLTMVPQGVITFTQTERTGFYERHVGIDFEVQAVMAATDNTYLNINKGEREMLGE